MMTTLTRRPSPLHNKTNNDKDMSKKAASKAAKKTESTPAAAPAPDDAIVITKGIPLPPVRRLVQSKLHHAVKTCPIGGTFPINSRNGLSHAVRVLKERGELDASVRFAVRNDPLGEAEFRAWRTE